MSDDYEYTEPHIRQNLFRVSTADLVAELAKREGVGVEFVHGWVGAERPEEYMVEIYRGHGFVHNSGKQPGPAQIIVVQKGR